MGVVGGKREFGQEDLQSLYDWLGELQEKIVAACGNTDEAVQDILSDIAGVQENLEDFVGCEEK